MTRGHSLPRAKSKQGATDVQAVAGAALANELANCHTEIGFLQSQTGEPMEGLRSLEQAVALGSALLHDHLGVVTYQFDLAIAYRRLA